MRTIIKRKKKLLVVGMILILPAFSFWLMFHSDKKENRKGNNAFNDKLPAANIKDSGRNKLEIYMKAQRDSARLKELEMIDPYTKQIIGSQVQADNIVNDTLSVTNHKPTNAYDANEQKVNDRINKILTVLNESGMSYTKASPAIENSYGKNDIEIERLEKLLIAAQNGDTATGNPEMKYLEGMLDKILDIQHPELVKARLKNQKKTITNDTLRYQVAAYPTSESDLWSDRKTSENEFWSLASQIENTQSHFTTFLAVVHGDQEILINETEQILKLRLLENVFIDNVLIPSGQFIHGKCQIRDGRAMVNIQEITYNNRVFPVQLTVYDQSDGMQGINIIRAGNTKDLYPNSADQIIQQLQLNAMNPSVETQAVTTGIETVKKLISNNLKKKSVKIKTGHIIILKPLQF